MAGGDDEMVGQVCGVNKAADIYEPDGQPLLDSLGLPEGVL